MFKFICPLKALLYVMTSIFPFIFLSIKAKSTTLTKFLHFNYYTWSQLWASLLSTTKNAHVEKNYG